MAVDLNPRFLHGVEVAGFIKYDDIPLGWNLDILRLKVQHFISPMVKVSNTNSTIEKLNILVSIPPLIRKGWQRDYFHSLDVFKDGGSGQHASSTRSSLVIVGHTFHAKLEERLVSPINQAIIGRPTIWIFSHHIFPEIPKNRKEASTGFMGRENIILFIFQLFEGVEHGWPSIDVVVEDIFRSGF